MKIIAKGKINLNPRAPKAKKEDKYSELSDIKKAPKFNAEDKVIFVGLIVKYRGQECTIVKRSIRKDVHYYKIKFDDDYELKDITSGLLKTHEEYEKWLLDQENGNEDNQDEISDIERKIIEAGLVPMRNFKSCHNQMKLKARACNLCHHEEVCIYHKKYQYDKVKFE